MPAESKKQRKFMGLALAVKRGNVSPDEVSEEVRRAAESMTEEELRDFAKTKESGLPEKKKKRLDTRVRKEVIG
jgi:hypothetical protein